MDGIIRDLEISLDTVPRDLNYLTVAKLQVWCDVTMEMAADTRKNFSPGLKLELAALQL